MKSQDQPMRMEADDAQIALTKLLIGAYLDAYTVHSVQILLRFLTNRVVQGSLIAVDVVFDCDASVGDNCNSCGGEDFFEMRNKFISSVYQMIGKEISGVSLRPSGEIEIAIGQSNICLRIGEEEFETDSPSWDVVIDDVSGLSSPFIHHVYCAVVDKTALFFARDALNKSVLVE